MLFCTIVTKAFLQLLTLVLAQAQANTPLTSVTTQEHNSCPDAVKKLNESMEGGNCCPNFNQGIKPTKQDLSQVVSSHFTLSCLSTSYQGGAELFVRSGSGKGSGEDSGSGERSGGGSGEGRCKSTFQGCEFLFCTILFTDCSSNC